jgi:hypothetical protein
MLPTDVGGMFSWVGLGAAIQNILLKAAANGMIGEIEYKEETNTNLPVAIIKFKEGDKNGELAKWIPDRYTNRSPYDPLPLNPESILLLSESIKGFDTNSYWITSAEDLKQMAFMDAHSSYIRLEHKPLHDELFDILRFTKTEIEGTRYGLTFESLEVPPMAIFFARKLQNWYINKLISRLGIGKLVAKQLSNKLKAAGAICLLTIPSKSPISYMKAGQAMEKLWLTATSAGLSVQPYGVLPQYLTKTAVEPETFLPKYLKIIEQHRKRFYSIFTEAEAEFPVIVLRIGKANKDSVRNRVRLAPEEITRV